MSRTSLVICLLALSLAAGCKAQLTPQQPLNPTIERNIEVTVRSQFNIPPEVDVTLGATTPSKLTGYEELPVTLSHGTQKTVVKFLLSADGKTLARLDTFDLTKDPTSSISLEGRPVRGNPQAKVTIINFDDLECPYCARMHHTLFPSTMDHYKGLVRVIYKDNPLVEIHPWAMHAAVDANCLADQSGTVYWTYVDYLHSHGDEITGDGQDPQKSFAALDRTARDEAAHGNLDMDKLGVCLAKQDETQIRAEMKEAENLRLEGTPALFINGERIEGALPEEQVWMVIDRALRAAGEQPPPVQPQAPATPPKGN